MAYISNDTVRTSHDASNEVTLNVPSGCAWIARLTDSQSSEFTSFASESGGVITIDTSGLTKTNRHWLQIWDDQGGSMACYVRTRVFDGEVYTWNDERRPDLTHLWGRDNQMDGIGNLDVGRFTTRTRKGFVFTALFTGTISQISAYWIYTSAGYGAGDYGDYQLNFYRYKEGPLGTVSISGDRLGGISTTFSSINVSPNGGHGYYDTGFHMATLDLEETVDVVAGQRYACFLENVHSDPVNNYASWQYSHNDTESGDMDHWEFWDWRDGACIVQTDSTQDLHTEDGWEVLEETRWNGILLYSDDRVQGNAHYESSSGSLQEIDDQNWFKWQWTQRGGTQIATAVHVQLSTLGTTNTVPTNWDLIEDPDGAATSMQSGTFVQADVNTTIMTGGDYKHSFVTARLDTNSIGRTLTNGTEYALVLSGGSAGQGNYIRESKHGANVYGLFDGRHYVGHGYESTNGGTSWAAASDFRSVPPVLFTIGGNNAVPVPRAYVDLPGVNERIHIENGGTVQVDLSAPTYGRLFAYGLFEFNNPGATRYLIYHRSSTPGWFLQETTSQVISRFAGSGGSESFGVNTGQTMPTEGENNMHWAGIEMFDERPDPARSFFRLCRSDNGRQWGEIARESISTNADWDVAGRDVTVGGTGGGSTVFTGKIGFAAIKDGGMFGQEVARFDPSEAWRFNSARTKYTDKYGNVWDLDGDNCIPYPTNQKAGHPHIGGFA